MMLCAVGRLSHSRGQELQPFMTEFQSLPVASVGTIIFGSGDPFCQAKRSESCAGSGGKERRRKLTENSGACSSLHGWSLWRSW